MRLAQTVRGAGAMYPTYALQAQAVLEVELSGQRADIRVEQGPIVDQRALLDQLELRGWLSDKFGIGLIGNIRLPALDRANAGQAIDLGHAWEGSAKREQLIISAAPERGLG